MYCVVDTSTGAVGSREPVKVFGGRLSLTPGRLVAGISGPESELSHDNRSISALLRQDSWSPSDDDIPFRRCDGHGML
jgi:hypothetical protein